MAHRETTADLGGISITSVYRLPSSVHARRLMRSGISLSSHPSRGEIPRLPSSIHGGTCRPAQLFSRCIEHENAHVLGIAGCLKIVVYRALAARLVSIDRLGEDFGSAGIDYHAAPDSTR